MIVADTSAIVDLILESPPNAPLVARLRGAAEGLPLVTCDGKLVGAHGHTAVIESFAR